MIFWSLVCGVKWTISPHISQFHKKQNIFYRYSIVSIHIQYTLFLLSVCTFNMLYFYCQYVHSIYSISIVSMYIQYTLFLLSVCTFNTLYFYCQYVHSIYSISIVSMYIQYTLFLLSVCTFNILYFYSHFEVIVLICLIMFSLTPFIKIFLWKQTV